MMGGKLSLIFGLFLAASLAGGRVTEKTIKLKHGKTSAALGAAIASPDDSVVFTFAGAASQRLTIHLEPDRTLDPQAVVVSPSGKQEGPGVRLKVTLDETGEYRIRVTGREQTSGAFRLVFSLR